jgi:endonuclease YncB( thermonuclease family)
MIVALAVPQSKKAPGDFKATAIAIVDGDTIGIEFPKADQPWTELFRRRSVRMMVGIDAKGNGIGIDTPESKDKRAWVRERAMAATNRLRSLCPLNKEVTIKVINVNRPDDKFGGRIDGIVYVNGVNVAQTLVNEGHAKIYNGKGKRSW